jgi:hypothetical protein
MIQGAAFDGAFGVPREDFVVGGEHDRRDVRIWWWTLERWSRAGVSLRVRWKY